MIFAVWQGFSAQVFRQRKNMATRAVMQDYRSMVVFLTEEILSGLAASDRSQLGKVDLLVRHVVNQLGLRHASEPTNAVLAAIVAQHLSPGVEMTALLQTCKSVMKTATVRATQSGIQLPAGEYIQTLPNAPDQLSAALRQHFAGVNLVFVPPPPRVSIDEVLQVARGMPLRSSHRQVQLQRQMQHQQQNLLGFGTAGMIAPQMQVAQTVAIAASVASVLQQRGETSLPNLQIFGQSNRSEPAAAPARNGSLSGLLDRAESQSSARAQVDNTAQPVPLLALTDGMAEPPLPAAPGVESVAPSVAAAAVAPSVSGKLCAEAPVPSNRGDVSGAGQPAPPVMGEAAAAADALARAHYDKTLPDLTESDEKVAMKKPASRLAATPTQQGAAGGGMKRPAASKSQCKVKVQEVQQDSVTIKPMAGMKRPAAKSLKLESVKTQAAAGMKRPAAAASVAKLEKRPAKLDMRRRLKLRPNGCGKCRYKPGCCPSCFN